MKKVLVEQCSIITMRDFRKELKHPAIVKDPRMIARLEIHFAATRQHMITKETTEISQKLWFRRTRACFDGFRVWFSCPSCNQNAYKLYLPPFEREFKCRQCHDLDYELHLEGKTKNYPLIKYRKAREKLDADRIYRGKKLSKMFRECLFWEERTRRRLEEVGTKQEKEFAKLTSHLNSDERH